MLNKSDIFRNNNIDVQLSLYIVSREIEIPRLFEKSHLINQANNKKIRNLY